MLQNISYRVLNTNPKEKSLTVRYWTDIVTENSLATSIDVNGDIMLTPNGWPTRARTDFNLTIYDTEISEENVIRLIETSAPLLFFRNMENILTNSEEETSQQFYAINTFIGITKSFSVNTINTITSGNNQVINQVANKVINYIKYNPNLILTDSNSSLYINNDGSYNK